MFRFFRILRLGSLSKSAAGKYIFYSFGEILLVVIGILIALQVNSWNEERKNRALEMNLYENLVSSLLLDSAYVVRVRNNINRSVESIKLVIENRAEELSERYDSDELKNILSRIYGIGQSFIPSEATYIEITSNGYFPLIRNDSLKNQIIQLYDVKYKLYRHVDQTIEELVHRDIGPVLRGDMAATQYVTNSPYAFDKEKFIRHYDALAHLCRSNVGIASSVYDLLQSILEDIESLLSKLRLELVSS